VTFQSSNLADTKKKAKHKYGDELEQFLGVAPAKPLSTVTLENFIKVPILQARYKKKNNFGYNTWGTQDEEFERDMLAPRIVWLNLDWKLSIVHRVVAGLYLHFFKAEHDE
jgi:hypothetical protein